MNIKNAQSSPFFYRSIDEMTDTRRSVLCMPIFGQNGTISGVVEIVNKRDGGSFDEHDEQLLEAFCSHIGIAVQNVGRMTADLLEPCVCVRRRKVPRGNRQNVVAANTPGNKGINDSNNRRQKKERKNDRKKKRRNCPAVHYLFRNFHSFIFFLSLLSLSLSHECARPERVDLWARYIIRI